MGRGVRWGLGMVGVLALACGGAGAAFRDRIAAVVDVGVAIFEEPEWSDLDDADRMLAYLAAHPDSVSVAWTSVDADGRPIPGTGFAHHGDTPRVLASTMKIVVLSAWARAVDEGAIDPDATVSLAEWDSWYLPGLDGGAHPAAYDRLGIPHVDGVASEAGGRVPLADVVGAMIRESDNAATDTVIGVLGDRMWEETERLGHDPIVSLFGGMAEAMTADDPCAQRAPVDVDTVSGREQLVSDGLPTVGLREQRRRLGCVLPRGTTSTYVAVMGAVAARTHISAAASERMARHLEWPMAFPSNQQQFAAFGSKGGSVPGVITEASYLIPREGDFAGERRAVAVFVNDSSGSAWLALMQSYAHQQLLVRLATDRAFADKVRAALEGA